MRLVVCVFLLLISAVRAGGQPPVGKDATRQPRILLLVDASSSMLAPWDEKSSRFQTAGRIIGALMDSMYAVNSGIEFGLRVYGHQSPAQNNDCFDTKQEVMFSKNNITQMGLRLASLRPFGVSPIAYSLKEAAANDLSDEARNAYSIILITDGAESCNGNLCDVVKTLIERKIYFKPYIISLVDYAPLRDQYSCLGSFLQAAKPEDIPVAIQAIVDAYRPLLSAPIMAVKLEDPPVRPIVKPRTDSIKISVPRLRESSSLADLNLVIQRSFPTGGATQPKLKIVSATPVVKVARPDREYVLISPLPMLVSRRQYPVAFSRPQLAMRQLSGIPTVSKPDREFIMISPLAVQSTRRQFPTAFSRPILRAIQVPRLASVSKPEPEPLKQEFIAGMMPVGPHYLFMPAAKLPTVSRRREAIKGNVARSEWEKPTPELLAALPAGRRRMLPAASLKQPVLGSYAYIISAVVRPDPTPRDTVVAVKPKDTATRTSVKITKLDPVKPALTGNPALPNANASNNKPKETVFTKETEEAKETSLAILFTDGRGKFFASTPQLQLLDAATGKLIKQFYRTVDASGNPDPQNIPPGTYNLLIAGRANMLMRRVTVEANKKNKVTIKVNNGSLRFRYEDAPNRPITEFEAIVNIRFEPGPTMRQRCTSELEYTPGNYYIEINTMPISRFNVDIDFGAITEIQIPQPGYVQFTNQTPKGRVKLFAPLGNKFVPFTEVAITGSPAAQKLQLKPGVYEAHWTKNPNLPYAAETVERFNILSNSLTEVELR